MIYLRKGKMCLVSARIPPAWSGNADGCCYHRGTVSYFSSSSLPIPPHFRYQRLEPTSMKINDKVEKHAKELETSFENWGKRKKPRRRTVQHH